MIRSGLSAAVYTLMLVSVVVGGGTLIAWLSPVGITDSVVMLLAFQGAGAALLGVLVWRVQRRSPNPRFEVFLDSVPRVGWIVFAGGHGVLLGTVLALAWQAPFMPLMLAFGAVAAVGGAFLPKLRKAS